MEFMKSILNAKGSDISLVSEQEKERKKENGFFKSNFLSFFLFLCSLFFFCSNYEGVNCYV